MNYNLLIQAQEGSSAREFNLLVPSALAGAVLGKGGQQLREIRDQYGCRVKMFKDRLPFCDERVLHIQGSEEKVCCFSVLKYPAGSGKSH